MIRLAPNLEMPLDAVTATFGIFGQRGSGKSTTGATFVEQIVGAGGRAVVFDPTGVWYGLTREGTGPGLPGVVLGGEHADAPLEPKGGALVAEFVVGAEYPLVVLDMKLLRKHHRQLFAMEFLEALYHDNRDPLHVVVDESPQFAPTIGRGRGGGDDSVVPRLLGAVEDVVSLGRSRGLGATLIAQRFAMVNANVREQIATLIAHQLVGKNDRTALKGWIEANGDPEREKEMLDTIARLGTGSALVWSPTFLDFFGMVELNNATTFDSRATPKVGEARLALTERAPVDLAALRERMEAVVDEVETSPTFSGRKRLAEAERLVKQQAAALAARPRVEVPVLTDDEREKLAHLTKAIDGLSEQAINIAAVGASLLGAIEIRRAPETRPADPPRLRRTSQPKPPAEGSGGAVPEAAPGTGASGGASTTAKPPPAQRILNALAWWESIGVASPTRVQTAYVAGYKASSGGYRNLLGQLRGGGLIEYPSTKLVQLTDMGRTAAVEALRPRKTADRQAAILHMLRSDALARVLSVLIEADANPMTRAAVADACGYTPSSGGYRNLLGKLRGLGLIDYPDQGTVVATDLLFSRGRVRDTRGGAVGSASGS